MSDYYVKIKEDRIKMESVTLFCPQGKLRIAIWMDNNTEAHIYQFNTTKVRDAILASLDKSVRVKDLINKININTN